MASNRLDRYLVAVVVSGLGDWFTYVALTTIAASSVDEGSALRAVSVGAVALAHAVPRAVLAPVAGWLADRFDRRTVFVVAEVLRGVVVLGMAWAAVRGMLVLLHALHALRMGLGAISDTAGRAALPQWVEPEALPRANQRLGVVWSATFVVGIVAGGAFATTFTPTLALLVDAASFFVAGAIALSLPRATPGAAPRAAGAGARSIVDVLRGDRALARAAFVRAPLAFVHGAAFVISTLGIAQGTAIAGTALGVGLLHGVRAIGNAVGSAVALRAFFRVAATPLGALGAAVAVYGRGGPVVLLVAGATWGLGMGANWTFGTTEMQRIADRAWLGRVVATDAFAYTVASALGGVVAVAAASVDRGVLALALFAVAVVGTVVLGRGDRR